MFKYLDVIAQSTLKHPEQRVLYTDNKWGDVETAYLDGFFNEDIQVQHASTVYTNGIIFMEIYRQ